MAARHLLRSCCLLMVLTSCTWAQQIDKSDLRRVLRDYDRGQTPENPTEVDVGFYIKDMDMDEVKRTVQWTVYLRLGWTDSRMSLAGLDQAPFNLESGTLKQLWRPDIFIRNAINIRGFDLPSPQVMMQVREGGKLWMVRTIEMTTRCPLLRKDVLYSSSDITCSIFVESYGHKADKVSFRWLPNPLEFDTGIYVPHYTLTNFSALDCSKNYTTGSYSCLEAKMQVSRSVLSLAPRTGMFLVSFILVVISWLSFWLDGRKVMERVSLSLGVTLTLVLLGIGVHVQAAGNPDLDLVLYMGACIVFVLTAILEYALAYGLLQWMPSKITGLRYKDAGDDDTSACDRYSRVLDVISGLVIFPALFIIFNIGYWMKLNQNFM